MKYSNGIIIGLLALFAYRALAADQNTKNSPHIPISHCYHWLDEKGPGYLTHKYQYAQQNNGDITFYTTPGTSKGAMAGPGLYCAKSPTGSYNYGDRVLRIDLVDDIVLLDDTTGRKYCGHDGSYYPTQAQCDARPWDIKFYSGGGVGNYAWYVIRDPQAIAQWSANSQQLESDLNLNKSISDQAFQTHADNTLTAIFAERKRLGELVFINHKARMNLMDILKDPTEVAKIPPMSVLARMVKYNGADLTDKFRTKLYKEQLLRALKDNQLEFNDYDTVVSGDPKMEAIFADQALENLKDKKLEKTNVISSLIALDKYSNGTLSAKDISKAWIAIFKSQNIFSSLNSYDFKNATIISTLFSNLPDMVTYSKLSNQNKLEMLKVFNKYVQAQHESLIIAPYIDETIENYLINSPAFVMSLYDPKLNNQLLAITPATVRVLHNRAKSHFQGLDPMAVGQVVDHIKAAIPVADFPKYAGLIKALELPMNKVPTYQMLGDFTAGKTKLPSMITTEHYFSLLFNRSIEERNHALNPSTNTFRLTLSAFFEYYFKMHESANDDAGRLAAKQEAEATFLYLYFNMDKTLLKSYGYALLQNASFFSELDGLMYDVHPTDKYVDHYGSGDANFDAQLEEMVETAIDGSFIHALIFKAVKQRNNGAKVLLQIVLDSLTSNDFDQYMQTNEFQIANQEKNDWRNFVYNRHIQNAGRNRTQSDLCGVAVVLDKFDRDLKKIVAPAQKALIDKIVSNEKAAGCKL